MSDLHGLSAFVFATDKEARPLLDRASAVRADSAFEVAPLYHLQLGRERCLLLICGMGMAPAATSTRALLTLHPVRRVINCGIAGALREGLQVGDLLNIDRVFSPQGEVVLSARERLIEGCENATLLTLPAPVFDIARKAELAQQADLVDMEGAVIASVTHECGLPCQLLKGVSDAAVDRAELHRNLNTVSRALAERICRALDCPQIERISA